MTNTQNRLATKTRVDAVGSPSDPHASLIDTEALMKDLLDRAAEAQLALFNARAGGDRRGTDEALLRLRAAALLIASIPATDDLRRFAVLAAALLAAEDDDASSHARRMVEHAIGLSEDAALRMSTPSTPDETTD